MRTEAYIIDCNGNHITGLQPASRCDHAVQVALRTAEETGGDAILVDSDGEWLVRHGVPCVRMDADRKSVV